MQGKNQQKSYAIFGIDNAFIFLLTVIHRIKINCQIYFIRHLLSFNIYKTSFIF